MSTLNDSKTQPMNAQHGNDPEQPTMTDQIKKAAVSEDQPMGRKAPQAPFALVGLSYLAALAVVVLIAGWIIFMVLK